MIKQIGDLAVQLLIAVLVWRYYRERSFPLSEKYSTFGPRFWTGTVDACVIWPVTFVLSLILSRDLPAPIPAIVLFFQQTAWLGYTVALHAKFGQTYGKMVCKVRVVDFRTEGVISLRQALLREGIPIGISFGVVAYEALRLNESMRAAREITKSSTFWLIAMLPILWFLAEVFTMLTNDKRRALHDFIAGTVVVRTNVA